MVSIIEPLMVAPSSTSPHGRHKIEKWRTLGTGRVAAGAIQHGAGVVVVPDILANAGGAIVSYFE